MDKLTPKARAIYDLLKGDLAEDMDKKLKDHLEGVVKSVRKLLDETMTKLDGLFTTQINEIRDDLGGDIGHIWLDLDKVHRGGVEVKMEEVVFLRGDASSGGVLANDDSGHD